MTGRANSVGSMELWGRHMGRHCVVDKIVTFLGAEFPFFSAPKCRNFSEFTGLVWIDEVVISIFISTK